MKTFKVALIVLILAAAAYPQTKDLGMGAFANESGPILMAVDAQLVGQSINNPYAMFVLFMGARDKDIEPSRWPRKTWSWSTKARNTICPL